MVDFTLLGTGGGMPTPERFLSATLINYEGTKILIDCGEGTQVSMKLSSTGFKDIDLICITHAHGDHIIGLPGLLATIGNSGKTSPLTIIGPIGITDVVNGLRVVAPYLPYELNIIENPTGQIELIEDMVISTLKLDHSAPCLGYSFYFKRHPRFDVEKALSNNVPKNLWNILQKGEPVSYNDTYYTPDMVLGSDRRGIKISLTTDTRPIDTIPLFIKNSDLFICEGTYGDDNDIEKAIKNKHMTFSEAAALAFYGNVKKLLLTHFSPAMSEPEAYKENAEKIFKNTVIGEDRIKMSLSFS